MRRPENARACVLSRSLGVCAALFALSCLLAVPGAILQFTASGRELLLRQIGSTGVSGRYLAVNLILYRVGRIGALLLFGFLAAALGSVRLTRKRTGFRVLASCAAAVPKVLRVLVPILPVLFAVLCVRNGAAYLRRNEVLQLFSMLMTEGFLAALLAGILVWLRALCRAWEDVTALAEYVLVTDRADAAGCSLLPECSAFALAAVCLGLAFFRRFEPLGAASYVCAGAAHAALALWLGGLRRNIARLALEMPEMD